MGLNLSSPAEDIACIHICNTNSTCTSLDSYESNEQVKIKEGSKQTLNLAIADRKVKSNEQKYDLFSLRSDATSLLRKKLLDLVNTCDSLKYDADLPTPLPSFKKVKSRRKSSRGRNASPRVRKMPSFNKVKSRRKSSRVRCNNTDATALRKKSSDLTDLCDRFEYNTDALTPILHINKVTSRRKSSREYNLPPRTKKNNQRPLLPLSVTRRCGIRPSDSNVSDMPNRVGADVRDKYDMDEKNILGKGSHGVVYKGREKETGNMFAIKEIEKSTLKNLKSVLREIA
eukprot:CAMPEP_0194299224 /NCGR_PEP_ID=MMETSP0169-20130528/60605_1 /TAXON_ID=218684 /ORGANISM="Corethron pennatum, Strain L29A3" /LENGTH=285 /DNA_ID=CAMNT_0039049305 /DNA_START=599 /DNA_END=1452 /DNA_ORIENTATION=+